tara:strand:+ start:676 stop:1950 length:1275 start_codon:yes stop_codon:yes gene_type:complete
MLHSLQTLSETESGPELLVCIRGTIYDVTRFASEHPGGRKPLQALVGRDATEPFLNYHPARVHKLLSQYRVGRVTDWTEKHEKDKFAHDMRKLRALLVKKGLFERTGSFYVKQAIWLLALFFSSMYLTVFTPFFRIGAVLMGIFWQQLAFVGHDVGHSAVFQNRSLDSFWGIVLGNSLGGIGLGWWRAVHDVHHVVPNSIDWDPDNQHTPVFATDKRMLTTYFSEFHEHDMVFTKLAQFLIARQHLTYYPVMAFARVNLYIQSILFLWNERSEHRKLEIATLLFFWTWIAGVCVSIDNPVQWMVLSTAVSGILEIQVTLSHYAEVSYSGRPHNDSSDSWFRNQIRTTLDIDCYFWMDWFGGGLQFQTAHHIFPKLPRANLREATDMLKLVCKKNNVQYNSLSFYDANVRLIKHLKSVAAASRTV